MKIAHSMSGLRVSLNAAEKNKLEGMGGRLSMSLSPGSEKRFLEFRPYDASWGRAVTIMASPQEIEYPWRLWINPEQLPVASTLPGFGPEEVNWTYEGASSPKCLVVERPPMKRPLMVRAPRKKTVKLDSRSGHAALRRMKSSMAPFKTDDDIFSSVSEDLVASHKRGKEETSARPPTLKEAIDAVNAIKRNMGDNLVLGISPSGLLNATMALGEME